MTRILVGAALVLLVILAGALYQQRRRNQNLEAQLEAGEFGPLYESLRTRIYRHGRKFTPVETLERAIGATEIDPQPYLAYLRSKVAGLQPA
mgnify:CR=1 FL=1